MRRVKGAPPLPPHPPNHPPTHPHTYLPAPNLAPPPRPLRRGPQSDRFTRLAMLRSAAGAAPWPAPVRSLHSPLHTGDGVLPATNGALMAAMGLMHSVWLPKGVDDSSGVGGEAVRRAQGPRAQARAHRGLAHAACRHRRWGGRGCALRRTTGPPPWALPPCSRLPCPTPLLPPPTLTPLPPYPHAPQSDWTLWATLRDHTLRTFYYRTANSPQWQAVRLPRVDWAKLRAAKRLGTAPMRTLAWAADASSGWL